MLKKYNYSFNCIIIWDSGIPHSNAAFNRSSDTKLKGTNLCQMRHLDVFVGLFFKFTFVKLKGYKQLNLNHFDWTCNCQRDYYGSAGGGW